MAGVGQRFKERFPTTLKPFIKVKERHLFEYALQSINGLSSPELFFILKNDDADTYESIIKFIIPAAHIIRISKPTRGALETCLIANEYLNPSKKLLILDSDLFFSSQSFLHFIENAREKDCGFPIFQSQLKRFSYCKEENGRVSETAEKEVISNNAMIGAYFFGTAETFFHYGKNQLEKPLPIVGEYYISPLYNQLIADGFNVHAFKTEKYFSLGTPEEVDAYLKN
jgi:choline kinase